MQAREERREPDAAGVPDPGQDRPEERAPRERQRSRQGTQTVVATAAEARDLLRAARRIAIVGASPDPARPSHGVMAYLLSQGYECVPVNPNATEVLGRSCFPDLAAAVMAGGPFDVVDVFRRPEAAPEIARAAVAAGCRALWLQLGVASPEAVRIATEAGLPVVMDRCTAIEHRALRAERGRSG